MTWPPIHYCARCDGPLHKTLWTVGAHPDCSTTWEPDPSPPASLVDPEHERVDLVPEPEPEPDDDLPPIWAELPLHNPTDEIDQVRSRNRWDD
jgi:hypothetical protein